MLILRQWRFIRDYRSVAAKQCFASGSVRFSTRQDNVIQEGDCAVLRHKGQSIGMTVPLCAEGRTITRLGNIEHSSIIGKQPRDVVISSKGKPLRVHAPTLEEYIVLTPRLVTPIYPADANLIVSLLDLHPDNLGPDSGNQPAIEILEAGTGHGALTLHLARAIHAAKVGAPSTIGQPESWPSLLQRVKSFAVGSLAYLIGGKAIGLYPGRSVTEQRRMGCHALVHTVDVSSKHSQHAAKIVKGFRRGMYARDVDFAISDVSGWIEREMHNRNWNPFLSHVFLDLPSTHTHVEKIVSALRVDGKLLVFNPSITQINSTIERIKSKRLPLQLEKVVEIGPGMTGGRIWDVRFVKPRVLIKEGNERAAMASDAREDQGFGEGGSTDRIVVEGEDEPSTDDEGMEIVCRPKVGERMRGGGFIALWSRNKTGKDF